MILRSYRVPTTRIEMDLDDGDAVPVDICGIVNEEESQYVVASLAIECKFHLTKHQINECGDALVDEAKKYFLSGGI